MMAPAHPTPADPTAGPDAGPGTSAVPAAASVAELHALIGAAVAALVDPADWTRPHVTKLNLVAALADTHQRGLGWLTPDASRMLDDLLVKERREYLRNLQDGVKITGAIAAPGSIAALAWLSEVTPTTWTILAAFRKAARLAHTPYCLLPHRRDLPLEDALRLVADAALNVTHPGVLRTAHTKLEDLVETADNLADPPMEARHPGRCPHCGRESLVIHMRDLYVHCGDDPDTGQPEPCVCSDHMCPCKASPVRFRHTWTQQPGPFSTTLRGLASAQRARDEQAHTNGRPARSGATSATTRASARIGHRAAIAKTITAARAAARDSARVWIDYATNPDDVDLRDITFWPAQSTRFCGLVADHWHSDQPVAAPGPGAFNPTARSCHAWSDIEGYARTNGTRVRVL